MGMKELINGSHKKEKAALHGSACCVQVWTLF